MTRITEEQVPTVRALYALGMKQHELAARFRVGQPTISKVIGGGYRKYIPDMVRRCIDCKVELTESKKRCDPCRETWKNAYYRQWYSKHGRKR